MRKQTVKKYVHPVTGNILEMSSRCGVVTSVRLFDGITWHVAPIRKWGDNWETQLDEWHSHIVESA
jgi:hypothetical protein